MRCSKKNYLKNRNTTLRITMNEITINIFTSQCSNITREQGDMREIHKGAKNYESLRLAKVTTPQTSCFKLSVKLSCYFLSKI